MSNTLNLKICRCGRLHYYSNDLLMQLLEEKKELVLICSKCGDVLHIGADKGLTIHYDENADPNEVCYNMYSYSKNNEIIDIDEILKNEKSTIGKIIIDEGIGVYMETGYYADYYDSTNGFGDYNSHFGRNKPYKTLEDLYNDMDEYDAKRRKVRMDVLLNMLTYEQAEILSHYMIRGLNWIGTKHEKEWHKKS